MFKVTPVAALKDNYVWLIQQDAEKRVAIVDPGDAAPVLTTLKETGFDPEAILITHHHWDHVNGIQALVNHYTIPVYGPDTESFHGKTNGLTEGDEVKLTALNASFTIFDVPGHTAGAIAYYGHGMLFSGDTLFTAGCGRLFEGTAEQMYLSLTKLAELPNDTKLYCGHEYTLSNLRFAEMVEPGNTDIKTRIQTTQRLRENGLPTVPDIMATELLTNPFLRTDVPGVIAAAESYAGKPLSGGAEVFGAIRAWKDSSR